MAWLQQVHEGTFRQVVALDEDGNALTRTWVVAEIAQAQRDDKLQQRIQVLFPISLASRSLKTKILWLDVWNCQASNPADTEMILAKIEDKDGYKESVRQNLCLIIRPGWAQLLALVLVVICALAALVGRMRNFWMNYRQITHAPPAWTLVTWAWLCMGTIYEAVLAATHVQYGFIGWRVRNAHGHRAEVLHWAEKEHRR